MLKFVATVTLVALCVSLSHQSTTELICKETTTSEQNAAQGSKSPYILSTKQHNTHSILVTISSEENKPFSGFIIKAYYPSLHKHQQSQFTVVDEAGIPQSNCQSNKLHYITSLLWTLEEQIVETVSFEAQIWYNTTTYWTTQTTVDPQLVGEAQNGIPPDPTCGKTKACFSNCTDSDCEYIVSWIYNEKNIIMFNIKTKVKAGTITDSWAAIGLSANRSMPGSSIMMCLNEDDKMSAQFGYTVNHTYAKLNDSQHTPTFVSGSTEGNVFSCTVQRDVNLSTDKIFSLRNEWYLLFAHGNITKGVPLHHTNKTASFSKIDFLANIKADGDDKTDYFSIKSASDLFPSYSDDSQNQGLIIYDSECDVSKSCIYDCKSTGCDYLVSWTNDGNDVTFNITTTVESGTTENSWVAVGLSPNGLMDKSSIIMCMHINGTVVGQYGYTVDGYRYMQLENKIPIIESSTIGDIFHCVIKRPIITTYPHIFNLTEKWYIIFAHGEMRERDPTKPQYHDFRVPGKRRIDFLAPPEAKKDINGDGNTSSIQYDKNCGFNKGCFYDCPTQSDCKYLVTWTRNDTFLTFHLQSHITPSDIHSSWMAVGFSKDGRMPLSSVMMCKISNATFEAHYGTTSLYFTFQELENEQLTLLKLATHGDVMQCIVTRPIISSSDLIYNLDKEWYLLFAHGSVDENGLPQMHDFRIPSNNTIDFLIMNKKNTIPFESNCGVDKGCFYDCPTQSDCTYLITWTHNGTFLTFNLQSHINQSDVHSSWMAVGFSKDGYMPDSSVMMCKTSNGTAQAHYGRTTIYFTFQELDNDTLTMQELTTRGNIMQCTVTRPILSSSSEIYSLDQEWYLLFAQGSVKDGVPQIHDFKIPSKNKIDFRALNGSSTTVLPSSPETTKDTGTTPSPDTITIDPECGKTKGCFPQCSSSTCTSLVTWQKDKGDIIFEIAEDVTKSTINRWIAIGFSADKDMGGTSVVMCQYKDSADVSIVLGYNNGYSFSAISSPGSNMLTHGSMTVNGQIMRCSFRRAINSTDPKISDLNKEWYLLMGNGPIVGGTPLKHEALPISTSSTVDFQKFSKVDGGSQKSAIIKIHGCLMITSWIVLSSIGIIIARYFKRHWAKSTFMKQKIWFQIHRTCMILTVLCTTAGFILIMIKNKGYRELTETGEMSYVNYHPIFGVIVFSLSLLNPIIAMFRCAPDHENRPIFNWAHSIVGTSSHILGAITVAFGLHIPTAGIDSTVNYIIIAYAIVHVMVEFLLTRLSPQPNNKKQQIHNLAGSISDTFEKELSELSEESGAMKFVLFLHFVAMITTGALLFYFVITS